MKFFYFQVNPSYKCFYKYYKSVVHVLVGPFGDYNLPAKVNVSYWFVKNNWRSNIIWYWGFHTTCMESSIHDVVCLAVKTISSPWFTLGEIEKLIKTQLCDTSDIWYSPGKCLKDMEQRLRDERSRGNVPSYDCWLFLSIENIITLVLDCLCFSTVPPLYLGKEKNI